MRRNNGFALIAALLIVVVVAVLVLGTSFTSLIDRSISANQRGSTDAYYVAKAGVDMYKTIAFQAYRYYLEHPELYEDEVNDANMACGNYLSIGIDLNRDGVIDGDDLQDGDTLGPFDEGNGTYTINFEVAGRYIVLTSIGRVGRARSTVQIVAEPSNAGLFDQALFAGPGSAQSGVNGGVNIYGSVYIEGNPELLIDSDPDNDYVIKASGNFGQYNYYTKGDLDKLLSTTNVSYDELKSFLSLNYLEQEDMCAHLRVKNGKIEVTGSAAVGGVANDNVDTTGFKTTLEGVEVGNGRSDILPDLDNIEADIIRDFDLEPAPKFPKLDDAGLELAAECYPDEVTPVTWRTCLHNNGNINNQSRLEVRYDPISGLYTANYAFTRNQETQQGAMSDCDLSESLSGNVLTFGNSAIRCAIDYDADGEIDAGFDYDSSGVLTVHGVNNFQGLDLAFSKNVEVRFEDKATFFVEGLKSDGTTYSSAPSDYTTMVGGNVLVNGDILPNGCGSDNVSASSCPDADKLTFPNDSVLGFIVDNTFRMTGDNQNELDIKQQVAMGLFYAGNLAAVEKGGVVFGSLIAPQFTFTSAGSGSNRGQTSSVVYVPGLTYGSAPGFNAISDPSNPTFSIASFERR